jgi:uncharacterized membrane protein
MFGIRTPWTLDNEEVWRQTHQICGKWMFYGGIICAVLLAILPFKIGFLVFITGTMLLVIGIFYTSYSLHKKIVHN